MNVFWTLAALGSLGLYAVSLLIAELLLSLIGV